MMVDFAPKLDGLLAEMDSLLEVDGFFASFCTPLSLWLLCIFAVLPSQSVLTVTLTETTTMSLPLAAQAVSSSGQHISPGVFSMTEPQAEAAGLT